MCDLFAALYLLVLCACVSHTLVVNQNERDRLWGGLRVHGLEEEVEGVQTI